MEIGGTALAFCGLGAGVVAASLVALKRRLQLSKAKHPSLNGHARIARRIASFVPFYEYDKDRFFRSDNAPLEVAARRRDGFMRLSALYASRLAAKGNGPAQRAMVKTVQEIEAEVRAHGTTGAASKKSGKDMNDITDQELMAILRQNKITEA